MALENLQHSRDKCLALIKFKRSRKTYGMNWKNVKKVERKSGRSDVMVSRRFLSERMEDYSAESYIKVTSELY